MTPEQIFSLCNTVALVGWIILATMGSRRWFPLIPLTLGGLYAVLVALHWGETPGGFGTLTAVSSLFSNRWMLLAGWVHYLAFDLFIGSWEVRDAKQHGVPRWLVIPSLALTFMFGPAGLVLYFATRTAMLQRGRAAQL